MLTVFSIIEIIGTVAFAVSGALEAIRKKMDVFGVMILGLITAVGGGVIRDTVIGRTPPAAFENPALYAARHRRSNGRDSAPFPAPGIHRRLHAVWEMIAF